MQNKTFEEIHGEIAFWHEIKCLHCGNVTKDYIRLFRDVFKNNSLNEKLEWTSTCSKCEEDTSYNITFSNLNVDMKVENLRKGLF